MIHKSTFARRNRDLSVAGILLLSGYWAYLYLLSVLVLRLMCRCLIPALFISACVTHAQSAAISLFLLSVCFLFWVWRWVVEQPRVVAAAPYISQFVMLSSRRNVLGVELQAILPKEEITVSVVNQFMTQGQFDDLKAGEFGLILGAISARNLGVSLGDKVVMTLPEVSITPAGIFPRMKRFTVVGMFSVGAQVDQRLAMVHLNDAQRLFRRGDNVQGVRVAVDDIYAATPVMDSLAEELGDTYKTTDWSQTQGSLFQAIELEKRMVTLLLMIIIFVAALNIVTSLILMVADKRGDIAVLRTMGMTTREIMGIFIIQGASVGFGGIILGGILGCLLAINISNIIA